MSPINDKRIDQLLMIGQQLIAEATGLRNGPVNSGTARKGLSTEQKTKLVFRRYKTALKQR